MALELSTELNGERVSWPLEGDRITVGRSSRNTVHLPDTTVSKEHAELVRLAGTWQLRDLGSRNGTRVNGIDVTTDARTVREGDTLEFGQIRVRFGAPAAEALTQFSASAGLGSSVRINAQQILESKSGGPTGGRAGLVRLLAQAGRVLVMPRPLRETCEELLHFVEQAVPATRLIMLLREHEGSELVQIAARTRGVSAREPLALSRTIMDAVLDECTSVITRDASVDPRFQAQMSIVSQGIHSAMAVPLFDNEKVLGLLYADSNVLTVNYDEELLEIFTLLGNMAAVKITNSRLLETEQARLRMAQELATATRIQRTLLPVAPAVDGWNCLARLETCFEVGGDLYDFHTKPDGTLVFAVGDVSGKGMGAALLMSSVLASARVLYDVCDEPVDLITRLNAVVHRSTEAGHFVTMFMGWLDPGTGRLRYVNAGHNSPMLFAGERRALLDATGVPLGVLQSFPFTSAETTLEAGDLLAVFTDGIPEAQRGEVFFDDARLADVLAAHRGAATLATVADAVMGGVETFLDDAPRTDDLTLVLVRRETGRLTGG